MGFDKDDSTPVIQPQKRTTKVNIIMGVSILVFFILGGIYIAWGRHHARQTATQSVAQSQQ